MTTLAHNNVEHHHGAGDHVHVDYPERPIEYQTQDGALKILGFWVFLATDLILFACLFATFIVLRTHTDGGPTGKELFDVPIFTAETLILLTSSFTGGLATFEMHRGHRNRVIGWLIVTALLGLVLRRSRGQRVRSHGPGGRNDAAQRLPVRFLYAGWNARMPRVARYSLDDGHHHSAVPARNYANHGAQGVHCQHVLALPRRRVGVPVHHCLLDGGDVRWRDNIKRRRPITSRRFPGSTSLGMCFHWC